MNQAQATTLLVLVLRGGAALQRGDRQAGLDSFTVAIDLAAGETSLLTALHGIREAAVSGDPEKLLGHTATAAAILRGAIEDPGVLESTLQSAIATAGTGAETRAIALYSAGQQAQRNGNLPAAITAFTEAASCAETAFGNTDLLTATILSSLGNALCAAGDWNRATTRLRQALAIKQSRLGEDHPANLVDISTLGTALEKLGDWTAARHLAEASLAMLRRHPVPRAGWLPILLNNLGVAAMNLADFAAAKAAFEDALTRVDTAQSADIHDNLGLLLARLGDNGAAITHHLDALIARRANPGPPDAAQARTLMHLGSAALRDQDFPAAETYYRQALSLFERAGPSALLTRAACLRNLAILAASRRRLDDSKAHLTTALALLLPVYGVDHPMTLQCQIELAWAHYASNDLAEAAGLIQNALRHAADAGLESLRPLCWLLLSHIADRNNQPASAVLFGKLSVNAIQRQRAALRDLDRSLQEMFAGRESGVFRHLAGLLAKSGRIAEAGNVIRMLKEFELFEVLRRDPALDPRLTFAELTALEASWVSRGDERLQALAAIDAERSQTSITTTRLAERTAAGREAEQSFYAWLAGAQAACAAAHVTAMPRADPAGLPARTAILHLLPTAATLHLLLATAHGRSGREVAIAEPVLNRLIHEFRIGIEQRSPDADRLGAVLYNHLIAPIAGLCAAAEIDTLLIAAVGALRYLPFAALRGGSTYLAETIATVLLTQAAPADRDTAATDSLAAFGVTRAQPGFPALTAVADELARIAHGHATRTLCLDDDFTAASFKAGLATHRTVHVASHFVFEPAAARGSYLLLGDGAHLGVTELAAFQFSGVDLMTLSACETALGAETGDGSEVEGLGALVRRRGVNEVVASLWPVEDASTPALMEHFYRHRATGATAGHAMRAAQKFMLGTDYNHPFYWAPFIVMAGTP